VSRLAVGGVRERVMLSDADLVEIAMDFRNALVGSQPSTRYCAMVCAPLAGFLNVCGQPVAIQETLVGTSNHVWLLLPDGRALDPTADHYDATLPPVYLGARLAIHTGALEPGEEER
jgi:hypothetical protein